VVGSDSSPLDLLADGEGTRCAAPPPKPHPRIGRSGHVTGVLPTLKSWLRHCSAAQNNDEQRIVSERYAQ